MKTTSNGQKNKNAMNPNLGGLVLLLFILAIPAFSVAQSLSFGQVKLVTTSQTVPAGTVWKVESVIYNIPFDNSLIQSSSSSSCSSGAYRNAAIEIDGTPTKVGPGSQPQPYSSAGNFMSSTILPVWLPAGTSLSGGPCLNKVSVIEFTIEL
jgi:hypothetical protein